MVFFWRHNENVFAAALLEPVAAHLEQATPVFQILLAQSHLPGPMVEHIFAWVEQPSVVAHEHILAAALAEKLRFPMIIPPHELAPKTKMVVEIVLNAGNEIPALVDSGKC